MEGLDITLYSSPISDCAGRLRIALHLKNLAYRTVNVSLVRRETDGEDYAKVNALRTIPTLVIKRKDPSGRLTTVTLTQSTVALEYLEEAFPSPIPLLPDITDPAARAEVRTLASIIGTDTHPLTTHRVGREIQRLYAGESGGAAPESGTRDWVVHWITRGLQMFEDMISKTAGTYSVGDSVSMADVFLLPELWTAERIGIDLRRLPTVFRVYGTLTQMREVQTARQDPASELTA